jgi:hypothetical protein
MIRGLRGMLGRRRGGHRGFERLMVSLVGYCVVGRLDVSGGDLMHRAF